MHVAVKQTPLVGLQVQLQHLRSMWPKEHHHVVIRYLFNCGACNVAPHSTLATLATGPRRHPRKWS